MPNPVSPIPQPQPFAAGHPAPLAHATGLPTMARHAARRPNPAAQIQPPQPQPATPEVMQQQAALAHQKLAGLPLARRLALTPRAKAAEHTLTLPDGRTVDVDRLIALVGGRPVERVPLDGLQVNRSRNTGFSPRRYAAADTGVPGILGDDGRLLDGKHRVAKLRDGGQTHGEFRRASAADLDRATLKRADAPPPGGAAPAPGPANVPPDPNGATVNQPPPTADELAVLAPPTAPLSDPLPPPLPMNPRVNPQRPFDAQDQANRAAMGQLFAAQDVPGAPGDDIANDLAGMDGALAAAKQAAQDNSKPPTSASGEPNGLSYATKPDHYVQGPEAWHTLAQYMPSRALAAAKHAADPHYLPTPAAHRAQLDAAAGGASHRAVRAALLLGLPLATTAAVYALTRSRKPAREKEAAVPGMQFVRQGLSRAGAYLGPRVGKLFGSVADDAARPFVGPAAPARVRATNYANSLFRRPGTPRPGFAPHPAAAGGIEVGFSPLRQPRAPLRAPTSRSFWGQAGQSAMGAVGGGLTLGDQAPEGPGTVHPLGLNFNLGGALAGAAAFHPGVSAAARRSGGLLNAPLRGVRGAITGQLGGYALDELAQNTLGIDPGLAQLGGRLGFAAGMGAEGARFLGSRAAPGGLTRALAGAVNRGERALARPIEQFGNEAAMTGFRAAAYPFRAGYNAVAHGTGTPFFRQSLRSLSPAARLGRIAGGVGTGAAALGYLGDAAQGKVDDMVNNSVAQAYAQGVPLLQQDMAQAADRYLQERGLLNGQGQFDPVGGAVRGLGGTLGGLAGQAGQLLGGLFGGAPGGPEQGGPVAGLPAAAYGMDPQAMAPMFRDAVAFSPSAPAGLEHAPQPWEQAAFPTAPEHPGVNDLGYQNEFLKQLQS